MQNPRTRSLTLLPLLLLLLPLAAQALTPVGAPLVITDETRCSFTTDVEVIATPKGAFETIWVDDWDEAVQGRRFGRDWQPSSPELSLLPLHGGLNAFDFVGSWAGRYELAINVLDFGEDPSDPAAAYRVSLDLEGDPLAPPARFETQRFLEIAPAAGGNSLQFRSEPPIFGPATCRSQGILARRIDPGGAPLSAESRVIRQASAWSGGYLVVDRLPNDTFVAVYSTCEDFNGLVARRLSSTGATVGKPINLPLPGNVGNFGGGNLVVATRGADFAVATMVFSTSPGVNGGYIRAYQNGKVQGLLRIPVPAGVSGIGGVVDLAASPTGYLLLFQGASSEGLILFAQELDARGVPQGAAVAITDRAFGIGGAVASLPDGRWIVVAREQTGNNSSNPDCIERLFGTILKGG